MKIRHALLAAVIAAFASHAGATPQVVATIKPIHSLTAGVMNGVGEPELLLSAGDSPHTYSMRPSEARAVRGADLVIRISPHMEAFLERAIEARGDPETVLTLADVEGVDLPGTRSGDAWKSDHDHAGHGHDHSHAEQRRDYHLWLDPQHAVALTDAITERLAAIDPDNAEHYRENAAAQTERLKALDARLKERLEPIRGRPYVVFHDAYQHFERRYGLEAVGAVTVNPEQPPGARHLQDIRGQIRDLGAVCVFSEPQFEPAIVRSLVRGLDARGGELDPLGAGLEPGPDAYFKLLERLADGFLDCLAEDE